MNISLQTDYFVEDGERVYPCRCGETHRGQYAAEERRHHNCFHSEHIIILGPAAAPDEYQGCCITCGATFIIVWEKPTP